MFRLKRGQRRRAADELAGDALHAVHVAGHGGVLRLPLGIKFGRGDNKPIVVVSKCMYAAVTVDSLGWLAAHRTAFDVARIDHVYGFIDWISPLLYALRRGDQWRVVRVNIVARTVMQNIWLQPAGRSVKERIAMNEMKDGLRRPYVSGLSKQIEQRSSSSSMTSFSFPLTWENQH